jgi:hypothetical protein
LSADFQKIKGARQEKKNNAAEYIGQQPKYSIAGLTPRSAVILRRHLGDPATKYIWHTLGRNRVGQNIKTSIGGREKDEYRKIRLKIKRIVYTHEHVYIYMI